jgi:Flp pilus assembly protein TadG
MIKKFLEKIQTFKRNESGIQLVELTIVLPIFLMLFAAVAEFGRYFYEYTTLAKSSRAAVRYLVTARTDGTDDLAAANLVVYGNVNGSGAPLLTGLDPVLNVKITRRDKDGNELTGGVPATVTIEIKDFKHVSLLKLGELTNSSATTEVDVKPSVTMRYLLTQPPI